MPENENELDLAWQLSHLDKELDRLSDGIEELQEDLRIVIKFALPSIVEAAHSEANKPKPSEWSGFPAPDPVFQESCRKFVEKYGSTP